MKMKMGRSDDSVHDRDNDSQLLNEYKRAVRENTLDYLEYKSNFAYLDQRNYREIHDTNHERDL
jgi:hypothetical protein